MLIERIPGWCEKHERVYASDEDQCPVCRRAEQRAQWAEIIGSIMIMILIALLLTLA
jgi:RNA polymerase subunit RPABC4/transcription elongation factor Spt4